MKTPIKVGQRYRTRDDHYVAVTERIFYNDGAPLIQPYEVLEISTGYHYNVSAEGVDLYRLDASGFVPIESAGDLIELLADIPEGRKTKVEPYYGSDQISIERIAD